MHLRCASASAATVKDTMGWGKEGKRAEYGKAGKGAEYGKGAGYGGVRGGYGGGGYGGGGYDQGFAHGYADIEQPMLIYPTSMRSAMKGGGGGKRGGDGGKGLWIQIPPPGWGVPSRAESERARLSLSGRGGGGGGAGGKKRKADRKERPPPGPLDESMVQQLTEFLNENGGVVTLGRLTTVFEGIKKAQVEEHFAVEEVSDGDFSVTISDTPGRIPAGPFPRGGTAPKPPSAPKAKRVKKERDPDAPPPPDLDSDVIEEIRVQLEVNGGELSLGKLTSIFSGLKKAQLVGHFEVEPGERDSTIRLFGGYQIESAVKDEAAEEGPKKKRKKERPPKDPNAPPPPDLDKDKVDKISDFITSEGGSVSLGKLTTAFSGVKKAQLERNFVVALDGEASKTDPIVSLN